VVDTSQYACPLIIFCQKRVDRCGQWYFIRMIGVDSIRAQSKLQVMLVLGLHGIPYKDPKTLRASYPHDRANYRCSDGNE
jgi:hypothetical protein